MSTVPGHLSERFVVFSGSTGEETELGHLPFTPTLVVRHASGRPLIAVRTAASTVTTIRAGARALVLVGPGEVDRRQLEHLLADCASIEEVTPLIAGLPGVFHAVATDGVQVRVQGTVTGHRRIYHAVWRGSAVASDRAEVLARLTAAPLDTTAVALRMLEPLPHPLADRVPWRGVHALPPDSFLLLGGGPSTAQVRWWHPPEPTCPIEEGAPAVRAALRNSVGLHLGTHERVSCELSGGFDSTSLTWLAQDLRAERAHPSPVLAVTAESRDPLNDDAVWARRAIELASGIDHRMLPAERLPLFYADLDRAADYPLDEPSPAIAGAARVSAIAAAAREHGSGAHLTGYGGDQLFTGLPTLSVDLLRSRPATALRRIGTYRGMFDWPLPETLRQLLHRGPYRSWLSRSIGSDGGLDWRHPLLTWGVPVSLAPWTTDLGAQAIRAEFADAAIAAEPLAETPGRHLELDGIRDGARLARALTDITAHDGLPVAMPFLDDRVTEAALSVRIEDRADPEAYKPLLRAAMRGTVPNELLARTTKGEGSHDLFLGLRAHMPTVSGLWADSRLADLGLVDAGMLRDLCARPDSTDLTDGALLTTLACEMWVRSVERSTHDNG